MTPQQTVPRYAFIKAGWHADIVNRAYDGFTQIIPPERVDVFDVPGAFLQAEMPDNKLVVLKFKGKMAEMLAEVNDEYSE